MKRKIHPDIVAIRHHLRAIWRIITSNTASRHIEPEDLLRPEPTLAVLLLLVVAVVCAFIVRGGRYGW